MRGYVPVIISNYDISTVIYTTPASTASPKYASIKALRYEGGLPKKQPNKVGMFNTTVPKSLAKDFVD